MLLIELASIADSTSGWTQTRAYLSNRDLLDVIETKVSTATKAKFDYAHDNLGRRTAVAKTGEVYNRYGNGTQGQAKEAKQRGHALPFTLTR